MQLSLDATQINKHLGMDSVTKGMVLQARIEAKEAKGFILDLGLRDSGKGFLKFQDENSAKSMKPGSLVHVVVKSLMKASKVIKCELVSS